MNVGVPEMTSVTDPTDRELAQQWKDIDWTNVEKTVNNLQFRIASAAKKNDWKSVNKLSRLLTNSYYAKLWAVRKVTSNRGSRSPGIDGVAWISNADKMRAVLSLTKKGYHARPLKRKYIPKKNGKARPLSIPTMYDRAMQTLYALALSPIESVTSDKTSFGFKPYRSTKDAYAYLFICLSKKTSAQWVVEGDIKACFAVDEKLYPGLRLIRHSIHSECLYSDVHLWQRICTELRGQRGARMNLTAPNC